MHPMVVVAILAVLGLVGAGAFVVLRPDESSKARAAAPDPRTPEQIWTDTATANAVKLTLADFPAGWHMEPASDTSHDPDEKAAVQSFAACMGDPDAALVSGASEPSPGSSKTDDFQADSGHLSAGATVSMRPSTETAQADFAMLQRPQLAECFGGLMNAIVRHAVDHPDPGKEVPEGVSFGPALMSVTDLPGVHADIVALRGTVPVTGPRGSITEVFDFVFARKDRAELTLFAFNIDDPFPADLEVQLANAMADRVSNT